MTDYMSIYRQEAERYERLISREDYRDALLPAIRTLVPLEGFDVLETGTGTGRLARLLLPEVRSILAFDRSRHMVSMARKHLEVIDGGDFKLGVCDHRHFPVPDDSVNLVLSGWSVAYLVEESGLTWKEEVDRALNEMQRVLRPGGTILILETLGTGNENPQPPEHIVEYLGYLENHGFGRTWLRTDYCFETLEEAEELVGFFFGAELAERVRENHWRILPECTGIWQKVLP